MSLQLRILLLTLGLCIPAIAGFLWVAGSIYERPASELIVIGVAFLTLAVLGALWLGRAIAGPIATLHDAAARLEQGEPVDIPPFGVRELDTMADALRKTSERVRESKRAMEDRVAEALQQAQAAQTKLDQSAKLEAIGRLTGGIAHDFNNVLQTLNLGLQVLDQRVQDPQSRTMVETCQRAVYRARTLIQHLQSFSKRQPLHPVAVDLRDLLLSVETLLSKALPPSITLHINVSADLWPAHTDPTQFELALLNLLFNARDAMPNGGRIVISTYNARNTKAGDVVCIEVADVGSGIDPDVLPHVFDPFFTTKSTGQGSGLGLSQVYNLASGSGGRVEIESASAVGTVVRVILPKASTLPVSTIPRQAMPALSAPVRLLLVEDDLLVSKVVVAALGGLGFNVLHVANADEALKRLEDGEAVDIVFSDIVMPGRMSGIDLVDAIAQYWPALPVVLASGYSEQAPHHLNVRVMKKPYLIEDVARALLEALAKRSESAQSPQ